MKTIFMVVSVAILMNLTYGGKGRRGRHCPKPPNIQCFVHNNECCSQEDCDEGDLCCVEGCGNTCRTPIRKKGEGTRVDEDDYTCQIGIPTPDFCPSKPNIFCYRSSNQCCSDDDCCYGDICCEEFCGKKCRTPTKQETNGTRTVYSSTCQIDYE